MLKASETHTSGINRVGYCRVNGLDPKRIIPVAGNELLFADSSFDIVYARNVLEHTFDDPLVVLQEGVRVLRPGGILHTEISKSSPLVISRGTI